MTPDQQAELEQVAREFVETVLAREVCLSDGECTIVQQAARELLTAQREEVAKWKAEAQWAAAEMVAA